MTVASYHKPSLIAFAHYSKKNDIGGVTTWLQKFLLHLHSNEIPIIVYLIHGGLDVEESSLLHILREAGISFEIAMQSSYIEEDISSMLAFINRHQPRVFLPQCLESTYHTAGIAGSYGLPWAMAIHSDDPVYWAFAETVAPETNNGLMIGVSDYISKKAIQKELAHQPITIPYGVSMFENAALFSDSPFRVVFCGRVVEEQKRISLVLAAMSQACCLDPRIECWIIGDGDEINRSRDWVNERGLGDRIIFLGRLESSTVQSRLALCQVILLMSDYEGLPVALLEAMAIGVVPIVRSIPSGIPELVKNNESGLLVDDTPEQAANAIVRLLNHPQLWLKCSTTSQSLIAENYSEEISYQRWLNVIFELSDRSTITYPIKIPKRICLPPVHPDLVGRTQGRKPHIFRLFMINLRLSIVSTCFEIGRKVLPKSFWHQLFIKYSNFFSI
ncbi:glycosyltransferase [Geminocystis sp. NIES-3708]|uniref:glycosyltransferase family 4 protein n=1 Tax=Geminocystis sp. NIES-3708 TaxID=1615909 RepID=UPI0005FC4105|nr:glycosyltransferase family 4 protein [Geminocystis sp. NIES-3708]BAQ61807.1 glycosyltransferase [Geminocystis sp. NIES-3708]